MLAPRRLLCRAPQLATDGLHALAQIGRDAQDHDVDVRSVCANASCWDCTLEPTDDKSRLAVRSVCGWSKVSPMVRARRSSPLAPIYPSARSTICGGVPAAALTRIAEADGFHPAFRLARRGALSRRISARGRGYSGGRRTSRYVAADDGRQRGGRRLRSRWAVAAQSSHSFATT